MSLIVTLNGSMVPKKFIALIFFAALAIIPASVLHAQGTRVDSGKWPWKLPFLIHFDVTYEQGNSAGDYDMQNGQYDENFSSDTVLMRTIVSKWIDTTLQNTSYSLIDDTLNYSAYYNVAEGPGTPALSTLDQLSIVFDRGHDSIISFSFCHDSSGEQYSRHTWGFSYCIGLTGLRYDSLSVICIDTLLSPHFAQYEARGTETQSTDYQKQTRSTSISSISLSGIFRSTILTAPAAVSNSNQISKISLHSYPNPFSQSSTIQFTPETSGYADVSIVNLLGTEVAHLFSGELAAGEHSFVWSNPTGLPDGMYECLIRMNGQVQTLPMVLMH